MVFLKSQHSHLLFWHFLHQRERDLSFVGSKDGGGQNRDLSVGSFHSYFDPNGNLVFPLKTEVYLEKAVFYKQK